MTNLPGHPTVSVVIPFFNEGGNVDELIAELHRAMEPCLLY